MRRLGLALTLALCLLACTASAQTYNAYKSVVAQAGGTTQNISTSGTNLQICALVNFGHGGEEHPTMTVDGASAGSPIVNFNASNKNYGWCYPGATAGTNAVVIDSGDSPGGTYTGLIFAYNTVKQTSQPEANATGGPLSAVTTAVSVTTVTANAVHVVVFSTCGPCTTSASTGGTLRVPSTGIGGYGLADSGALASPGSHSITIGDGSFGDAWWSMSLAPLAGATVVPKASLLGVAP